jgi:hypothetical protein
MTSKERTIALSGYALQIAFELHAKHGQAWEFVKPTEDVYSVYLRNAQGARIYLQFESSKGYDLNDRVLVTGHMHLGKNGSYVEVYDRGADGTGWNRVSAPSITVALSRGCQAIAKDIAKRFLPEYLRVFAMALDKVQADADYDAQITANLQRLAKVAGVAVSTEQQCYGEVNKSFHFSVRQRYYDVTASAKDCSMKMSSLTIEQCEFIIKYLRGK